MVLKHGLAAGSAGRGGESCAAVNLGFDLASSQWDVCVLFGIKNEASASNSNVGEQTAVGVQVGICENASGVTELTCGERAVGNANGKAAEQAELVLRRACAAVGAVAEHCGDHWLAPLKLLGRRVEEPGAFGVWD